MTDNVGLQVDNIRDRLNRAKFNLSNQVVAKTLVVEVFAQQVQELLHLESRHLLLLSKRELALELLNATSDNELVI